MWINLDYRRVIRRNKTSLFSKIARILALGYYRSHKHLSPITECLVVQNVFRSAIKRLFSLNALTTTIPKSQLDVYHSST
jgi:hypothetical protein